MLDACYIFVYDASEKSITVSFMQLKVEAIHYFFRIFF